MKRILSAALACAMMLLGAAFAECPQFSEEDAVAKFLSTYEK